jgi:hypothetical protein
MLAHCGGMMSYLHAVKVLLKDFASHAEAMTKRLREASEALARKTGRPIRYLASSAINKEDIAREIARMDGIEQGLICILTAVEPCLSYEIVRDRNSNDLDLQPRHRKCLHLYHYHIHPRFGFMHARIQTWFPFAVQICLNGREWLARSMDAEGLHYVQRDNCFTWLADPGQAQHLMAQQVRSDWPELLNDIAHGLNPEHAAMFAAFRWTITGRPIKANGPPTCCSATPSRLAATATRSPLPCWSVFERRMVSCTPRPGTASTSPRVSATSSERRSAAPKPSNSMARSRAPSGVSAAGRAASIFRNASGTAGVAWRRGRSPLLRVMPSSTMESAAWRRSSGTPARRCAVRMAARPTRKVLTAQPSSARRTRYMAMVSGSPASGSRPILAHHAEKPAQAAR